MENKNKQIMENEIQEFLENSPYSAQEKRELTLCISGISPELNSEQEDFVLEESLENWRESK